MIVVGKILFRTLFIVVVCQLLSQESSRWFSLVIVVSILVVFVSKSTFFHLPYPFSERLCKPASRLGNILVFETAENRTFLIIDVYQDCDLEENFTDPNLFTLWQLDVTVKHCRCEGCLSSQTRTGPIPSEGELSIRFCRHSLRRTEDTSKRWCEWLANIS